MRIFRRNKTYLVRERAREKERKREKERGYESKIVVFYVLVHDCFNLETTFNSGTNPYVQRPTHYKIKHGYEISLKGYSYVVITAILQTSYFKYIFSIKNIFWKEN